MSPGPLKVVLNNVIIAYVDAISLKYVEYHNKISDPVVFIDDPKLTKSEKRVMDRT